MSEVITKSMAQRYIAQCLKRIANNPDKCPIIFVDPIDENVFHLEAAISGPMHSPYENGVFLLNIVLSADFPFSPPTSIRFKRAMMHPNVTEVGEFLSELFEFEHWTPVISVDNILQHVWNRLAVPDVDSHRCDSVRAQSYRNDRDQFESIAKEYVIKYA